MRVWVTMACLIVAACGDDGLTESDVRDLPPGNATGSALSGTYELEAITVSCSGSCAPVTVFGLVISPCDVGARNEELATVSQSDGALQVDVDDSLWASRLEGGVYDDGSFDIGGVKTELGGAARFISHATGSLDASGTWTGELEIRSVGSFEGQSRDCTAFVEVDGARVDAL